MVTGANGYIGKRLVSALAKDSQFGTIIAVDRPKSFNFESSSDLKDIEFIECDLTDFDQLKVLPNNIDTVFLLAALNGTSRFYSEPYSVFYNSLTPTLNIIERYKSSANYIYTSSSEVYANSIGKDNLYLPTNELVPTSLGFRENPRWSYASAKLMGEYALTYAAQEFGSMGAILRYHNVYGPNMPPDHFIPDFMNRARSGDFSVFGANQTRAFTYIDDAIKGTLAAIKGISPSVPIFHIGNSEEILIEEAAFLILEAMNISGAALHKHPAPEGSVARRIPNTNKAYEILGWKAKIKFREGIQELIKEELCGS